MFKKIILASMLAAVSSFAVEDAYRVLEAHTGRVLLGTNYRTYDSGGGYIHSVDLVATARYAVIQNLELSLATSYDIFTYARGNDHYMNGFGYLSFQAAYQFIAKMNVFAGVSVPVEDLSNDRWLFEAGLKFSTQINRLLNFGAQLNVFTGTKGINDDMLLIGFADAHLYFEVSPQFTPYVGMNFQKQFSVASSKHCYCNESIFFGPNVGVRYRFNDVVGIDTRVGLRRHIGFGGVPSFFIANADLSVLFYF